MYICKIPKGMKRKLHKRKHELLPSFYEWAETFNPYGFPTSWMEEERDELEASYDYVRGIFERFEHNQCTENDYDDIYFHILQINDSEKIIKI